MHLIGSSRSEFVIESVVREVTTIKENNAVVSLGYPEAELLRVCHCHHIMCRESQPNLGSLNPLV